MPVTVLIPLITACINLTPVAVSALLKVLAEIKASKATTVQPEHVAAIKSVLTAHGVDTSSWDIDHAGE